MIELEHYKSKANETTREKYLFRDKESECKELDRVFRKVLKSTKKKGLLIYKILKMFPIHMIYRLLEVCYLYCYDQFCFQKKLKKV